MVGEDHIMTPSDEKAALARLVKYCQEEAAGLNLTLVAYCLSLAGEALGDELGTRSLSGADEIPPRRKRE